MAGGRPELPEIRDPTTFVKVRTVALTEGMGARCPLFQAVIPSLLYPEAKVGLAVEPPVGRLVPVHFLWVVPGAEAAQTVLAARGGAAVEAHMP